MLGAAVNAEYGFDGRANGFRPYFPLGPSLRTDIMSLCPVEDQAWENGFAAAIKAMWPGVGRDLATELKQALRDAASIDNLLEHRSDNEAFTGIAKTAIAYVLLTAERANNRFGELDSAGTVYGEIFRRLSQGCGRTGVIDALQRVSFVTFNYDRTLEAFLYLALQRYSRLEPRDAARAISNANIQHVYGYLGPLPFQPDSRVAYGGDTHPVILNEVYPEIRTFSESTAEGDAGRIKQTMLEAKTLVFLGCAPHQRNMELLQPERTQFTSLYATQYTPPPFDRISKPSIEDFARPGILSFKRTLRGWSKGQQDRIEIEDMRVEPLTCLQLIGKYGSEWLA